MAEEIQRSIGENAHVKMRRSRLETAIHIVLKGNPEATERQIQKIHDSLVPSESVIAEPESTYSSPYEPFASPFAPMTPVSPPPTKEEDPHDY
ncbi:MAG: hypothetical protein UX08_C0001G0018 [Candidatus Collierbacteria bacterium GW2011_GWB1_45_35]|nr:MAG: hypothetical protein UX08_C0001G0018 [Candidatus Collierbacteria bacterium GW2011_GWB1_45_35]